MAQIEYLSPTTLKPARRNARTHSRQANPADRRQHRAVRLHQPRPDRRERQNIGRSWPRRSSKAARNGDGTLHAPREHDGGRQASVCPRRQQNRALNAGWDEELLALELQELMAADLGFDLGVTGFSIAEVDRLIDGLAPIEDGNPALDALPDPAQVRLRCRPGDLWQLGAHRLICGDARDRQTIYDLMGGELAEMAFSDPPYNVPIEGNVGGLGNVRHRDFVMASGEMDREQFTAFLSAAFANLAGFSIDGSIHFVCMDWRHLRRSWMQRREFH